MYQGEKRQRGWKTEIYITKKWHIIIVGDLNSKIGKQEYCKGVVGNHMIHEETNYNEMRICKFAGLTNISAWNLFTKKHTK